MSNIYYRTYRDQVFEMARTIVIKSEITADTINRELEALGHEIDSNPYTWKYYINLAGMYFSTDITMTVISMDTLEEIEFTKENLEIHRATANAYTFGSRYYNELIDRYPDQELLIRCILNPIDMERAVTSQDGTILFIEPRLIEVQEDTLVSSIQEWVYAFFKRWSVPAYAITDEYYPAAQLAALYAHLPLEIMNCRLERTHTNEAHSYHIREYLASFNRLDRYIDFLTLKQQMFLYRNIRYILNNAGKRQTFDLLIEKIMSDRNLPLASYEMLHDVIDMPDELYPDIVMQRQALNDHPGDGSSDQNTVRGLLEKQFNIAQSNIEVFEDQLPDTIVKMENSQINRLPTKTLESAILDTTDSVPFTREETFLNHWIYLSTNDRMESIVGVPNPSTGVGMTMTPKEAFIIYLYAFNKVRGVELTHVPDIIARRVRKPAVPSIDQMRTLVNPKRVSDSTLAQLREKHTPMGVYISLPAFQDFCNETFVHENAKRNMVGQQEDPFVKAMMESAAAYMYQDIECSLANEQPYDTWMQDNGFEDILELGQLDLDLLSSNIVESIFGFEAGTGGSLLGDLQRAMLNIMEQLSSYGVHYLQSINSTSYRTVDTAMPRIHNLDSEYFTHRHLEVGHNGIHDETMRVRGLILEPRKQVGPIAKEISIGDTHIKIRPKRFFKIIEKRVGHFNIDIHGADVLEGSKIEENPN